MSCHHSKQRSEMCAYLSVLKDLVPKIRLFIISFPSELPFWGMPPCGFRCHLFQVHSKGSAASARQPGTGSLFGQSQAEAIVNKPFREDCCRSQKTSHVNGEQRRQSERNLKGHGVQVYCSLVFRSMIQQCRRKTMG